METLNQLLKAFIDFVPNLIGALIILIVGYIISRIVKRLFMKLMLLLKVDELGDKLNEIELVNKTNLNVKLSSIFGKFIYYLLMLFFAIAATDALKMPAVSSLVTDVFQYLPNLFVALIVLVIGLLLAEAIRRIVHTTCKSLGVPSGNMIAMIVFYFVVVNVLVMALNKAQLSTDFLSMNLSIVFGGIALAFAIGYGSASKRIMANFLSSFYTSDLFKVGDVVKIGDEQGSVIEMNKSSVILLGEKGKIIYPLSIVTEQKVIVIEEA